MSSVKETCFVTSVYHYVRFRRSCLKALVYTDEPKYYDHSQMKLTIDQLITTRCNSHCLWMNGLRNMVKSSNPVCSRSTSQLTGLIGSAAKLLVLDTTGLLQRSCRIHALAGWSCFGSMSRTNSILDRWLSCFGSSVYFANFVVKV